MLETKNLGRKSLEELESTLSDLGLGFRSENEEKSKSRPSIWTLSRPRENRRCVIEYTEEWGVLPLIVAMFRNQLSALVEHERIITTLAKAKELRPGGGEDGHQGKAKGPFTPARQVRRWLPERHRSRDSSTTWRLSFRSGKGAISES